MTWVKKEEKEKWRKMNSAAVMFTSRDARKTDLTFLEGRVWVCSNSRVVQHTEELVQTVQLQIQNLILGLREESLVFYVYNKIILCILESL